METIERIMLQPNIFFFVVVGVLRFLFRSFIFFSVDFFGLKRSASTRIIYYTEVCMVHIVGRPKTVIIVTI